MKDTIYLWFKEKANYFYYNIYEEDSYAKFENKMADAFLNALIHTEDHEATPFYIIKKMKNEKMKVTFKNFVQGKNTAKSFNQKHYASLQDIVNKIYLFNNLTKLDDKEKIKLYTKHLGNAEDEMYHNHFLEDLDQVRYSNFLTLSDLNLLKKNYSLNNINDFFGAIVQQISNNSDLKEIEEIGFFYPTQYNHNVFQDKHYLFEINPYKFHLKSLQNSKINKFLSFYFLEHPLNRRTNFLDYTNTKIPFHHGKVFTVSVAYIDPLKILEKKYQADLSMFNAYINKNISQEAAKELWLALLEKINRLTFYCVIAQFQNLVSSILVKKHNTKNYSKKSFIKLLINNETDLLLTLEKRKHEVLKKMHQYYEKHQLLKNHKLKAEDLGIYDSDGKKTFDEIEQSIDLLYSKSASLQLLYSYSLDEIKEQLKDFKVPQKLHKSFKPLLLDIITFETPSNLKNMHNDYIHNIHLNLNRNKLMELYGFSIEL